MDDELIWRVFNILTSLIITTLMFTLRQLAADVRDLTHLVGDLRDRVSRLEGRTDAS